LIAETVAWADTNVLVLCCVWEIKHGGGVVYEVRGQVPCRRGFDAKIDRKHDDAVFVCSSSSSLTLQSLGQSQKLVEQPTAPHRALNLHIRPDYNQPVPTAIRHSRTKRRITAYGTYARLTLLRHPMFMSLRAHPLKRLSYVSRPTSVHNLATHISPRPAPFAPRTISTSVPRAQTPALRKRSTLPNSPKQSGAGLWTASVVVGLAIGGALLVPLFRSAPLSSSEDVTPPKFDVASTTDSYLVMAPNTPAGRPGTLTPQEEEKLRELWALTMKVFGVQASPEESNGVEPAVAAPADTPATAAPVAEKEKKKSKLSVFSRHKKDKADKAETEATPASGTSTPDIGRLSLSTDDDKFGQTAEFKAAIANIPAEDLRNAFWSMVKHDHPDALLLRFLRARKWDVEKALVMMISTMQWRLTEMHVDDKIVKNGELGALENAAQATDAKARKDDEDFLVQLRMGKSYLHGLDNAGRPMCIVRARLHKAGEQTEESLERFTVYTIETARLFLRPPIDTAVSPPSPTTLQLLQLTSHRPSSST
jgi:hypothetical protein